MIGAAYKYNKKEVMSLLNRTEFIKKHAERHGITKKAAEESTLQVLDTITTAILEDGGVKFIGFGTFEIGKRAAKIGRNPQKNTEIKIPPRKFSRFIPGKYLKETLKNMT